MVSMRDVASFARWRLIPVRYATMLIESAKRTGSPKDGTTETTAILNDLGYCAGPTIDPERLAELRDIFLPRGAEVTPKERGAPFVNLVRREDFEPSSALLKFAFSREVLDPAIDYFCGDLTLDSIQVLHSYPTSKLRESQLWHRDYSDRKSFHCVAYLKDVLTEDKGPFVFVDKKDTRNIRKSPVIRRIPDNQFRKELRTGKIHSFYGKAGESVFVDPAVCYHYGSRCTSEPRAAIFISFNTSTPFAPPPSIITENADRLAFAASSLRPDLSSRFIRRMLRLR